MQRKTINGWIDKASNHLQTAREHAKSHRHSEAANSPALTWRARCSSANFLHPRARVHTRCPVFMRVFEQFALVLRGFWVRVGAGRRLGLESDKALGSNQGVWGGKSRRGRHFQFEIQNSLV